MNLNLAVFQVQQCGSFERTPSPVAGEYFTDACTHLVQPHAEKT